MGFFSFLDTKKKRPLVRVPTYRGNLADTALPEMLAVVYRHGAAGMVEAAKGDIVKKIYVKDGTFIHATSTDPNDAVLPYLLRTGSITAEQFNTLNNVPVDSEKKRSALVIERRYLSPSQLYQALRDRVSAIVWGLFWWDEGELLFTLDEEPEEGALVRVHVPIRHVIMRGVKRSPSAKTLVKRLGRKDTIYTPSYALSDLIDIAVDRDEYTLLALVDGKRTLYEVCAQGPFTAGNNAKLLYAFHVLHLIQKPAEKEEDADAEETEDEEADDSDEAAGAEDDDAEDEDEDEADEDEEEEEAS